METVIKNSKNVYLALFVYRHTHFAQTKHYIYTLFDHSSKATNGFYLRTLGPLLTLERSFVKYALAKDNIFMTISLECEILSHTLWDFPTQPNYVHTTNHI